MKRITSLFERRGRDTELGLVTPPVRSPLSPPETISKLTKAFVNSLSARQLSEFLTWMMYYDIVALPDSPTAWYMPISNMDMRGWVSLGDFLSRFSKSMDTGYGLDLVVLDSICDRINLERSTVHALLIRFADHEKMAYSQISHVVRQCQKHNLSNLETQEMVKATLEELKKLAKHLKPTAGSVYATWHATTVKQIQELLDYVVKPRITHLRGGEPLVTAATSDQIPKEVRDGIKLTYAFEALQPKRQVPLSRYGLHSELTVTQNVTSPSTPLIIQDDEADRARQHAIMLMSENHDLRTQIIQLQFDKDKLQDSNEKLARRFAKITRNQPWRYVQSHTPDVFASPTHDLRILQDKNTRPRPLSTETGKKIVSQPLHTRRFTPYKAKSTAALSSKYEDVFSEFDAPPSPPIRLSDPATGGFLEPPTPLDRAETLSRRPSDAARRALATGRRSGMVFTPDQKNLLSAIRGRTPESVEDGEDEDEGGDEVGTPTPMGRE